MAKFLVASLLCACLLLEGTKKVQAAAGDKCGTGTACDPDTLECDGGVCKTKVSSGGDCSKANTICDPDATLTCHDGKCKTTVSAADGVCDADNACNPTTLTCQGGKCKVKVGQTCAATDKCLANAECDSTSNKCACQDGYKASEDKTKCGAMGIASSILLVMAAFVTSRFF